MKTLGNLILMTAICIAFFMVFMAVSPAPAQQGNLPVPVQKLAPYPPVVCVTPNWTPEPCESRKASSSPYGPPYEPSGWQCGTVRIIRSEDSTNLSMEFLVTGTERRDNRFRLVGFDELYLNGKLCTPLPKPKIELLPEHPPVACLKPDRTEEPCESRRSPAQPAARIPAKTKIVLYNEPGGIIQDHVRRWQALAASGDDVEIRGPCVSACTLIMAFVPSDRICFGEAASLKFHMAGHVNQEPNIDTARWMLNQYPQDIRLWIRAKGGVEKMTFYAMWKLAAEELWAMGYRKCAPEPPPVPMTQHRTGRKSAGEEQAWREEIARDTFREAEIWRRETMEKAANSEGLHEGWKLLSGARQQVVQEAGGPAPVE